jgi:hypothetical protein
MESKVNSIGHNFGKEKTIQDIKSTKLLMILNLVNAMDLMTNEDLFKAFMGCKKLEIKPELYISQEFYFARTKVFELHAMKSRGQTNHLS